MRDEFFRGRTWPNFESFKADLDAYVMYWNTQRRQVKLKGLTWRSSEISPWWPSSLLNSSKFWDAVQIGYPSG